MKNKIFFCDLFARVYSERILRDRHPTHGIITDALHRFCDTSSLHSDPEKVEREGVMFEWHQRSGWFRPFKFRTEYSRNKQAMLIHASVYQIFVTCRLCTSIQSDTGASIVGGWLCTIIWLLYFQAQHFKR